MKKTLTIIGLAAATLAGAQAQVLINFDTAGNWTAGSASIISYASDHQYSEANWLFSGGPALRNTTTAQDGFAGAFGTYSWRLRDAAVTWTATYTAALSVNEITGFGFDARRWDGSPSPAYTVEFSLNGGSSWTTASSLGTSGVIDNAALGNTSNWTTFTQAVSQPTALAANQFVVRLSATGGERIMVDNFTAVPEPSTWALIGLGSMMMIWNFRRRRAFKA